MSSKFIHDLKKEINGNFHGIQVMDEFLSYYLKVVENFDKIGH
jgi:hypothetical protein